MNGIAKLFLSTFAAVVSIGQTTAATVSENSRSMKFEIGERTFLKNDEPYVIKAAELHYPRIPKEYWDHRIKMSKALGMNTICVYVFWNIHEQEPGKFDFTGNNDLREFIKLCQQNDMNVIVRPGPYVCAEWEMGGLPWWLLKKEDIQLRDNDPYFLERVSIFEDAVASQIADLTVDKGGPIIMVQVENEYGAYGVNKEYVANIRDILKKHYPGTILFQCDWSSNFQENGLDDLFWTMNFGTGADINQQFEELRKVRPDSPLMCSEFWSGWFDKWGANHETRPTEEMIDGITEMLDNGISFSLYMTHGGTNFGHWAGANSPGYAPDVTSYDYDAPISENGQATPKYWSLRGALQKYATDTLMNVPEPIPTFTIPRFEITEYATIFDNLPKAIPAKEIKTMEEFNQGYGSILYRTNFPFLKDSVILNVNEPHDYALIYVDGKLIGKLDRRLGETSLKIPPQPKDCNLDIFVEATGRINFGRAIKDFKGISENVTLEYHIAGVNVTAYFEDWEVYLFPDNLDFYKSFQFSEHPKDTVNSHHGPGVYKSTFNLTEIPGDTFLNFETWGKGLVYVNGHGIGRIWDIGPQQTLYMPGPWLKEGENEILIFDIVGPHETWTEGLTNPIIDKVIIKNPEMQSIKSQEEFEKGQEVITIEFDSGNGWKEAFLGKTVEGRYITLQIEELHNPEDNFSAISELYLVDPNGKNLEREKWRIQHLSSEQKDQGNHTGDKIYDLQESTYWASSTEDKNPEITIDLGEKKEFNAIRYLPRMESGAPGSAKKINVYVK